MSDSFRPIRPILRHPFVEEVLPVVEEGLPLIGGPHGHHPAHPKPPAKPCAGAGLHSEARVRAYVHGFKHLQHQWPKLTPEQRRLGIQNLVNKQLRATGSPPLTFRGYKPPDAGTGGEFDFPHWTMKISDHYTGAEGPQAHHLADWDAKVLATMVYHESRHSEQWYMAARKRAADLQAAGGLTPDQQAHQIAQEMTIPLPIAQQAQKHPMPAHAPHAPCAQQLYDSISGAHAQARNDTLNQFHRENVELSDAKARTAAALAKSDAAQRVAFLNPARANPALLRHDMALLQQAQAHEQNVQHRSDLAKAAYQALPEEADAYATGHQVEGDWDGQLLQW